MGAEDARLDLLGGAIPRAARLAVGEVNSSKMRTRYRKPAARRWPSQPHGAEGSVLVSRAARERISGRPPGSLRFPRAHQNRLIQCSANAGTWVFN
jgi:hypothetical protein